MAYTRLVESILIVTVLVLTIFLPVTHAQVPERAFERRQDAILEKQAVPPPRTVAPQVVRERPKPQKAGPHVTKTDLQQINQNMEALKQTLDQLNQTLNRLADALARQSRPEQQRSQ